MKNFIVLLVVVLSALCFAGRCNAQDLSWENISREIVGVNTAWVNPDDPREIYVGTDNGIFKSDDAGGHWSIIARQRRAEKGYYRALVKLTSGDLYLGTSEGILISKDEGKNWNKMGGILGHVSIEAITPEKSGNIYVLSEGRVFKIDPGMDSYEKLAWRGYSKEDKPSEADETDEQPEECEFIRGLKYVAVDPASPGHILLVFDSSVVESKDGGNYWTSLPGLSAANLKTITISVRSTIYAATDSRVFRYDPGVWKDLELEMAVNDIHAIVTDGRENIYLATARGLFKSRAAEEPTIQQVREAAIEYADVNIDKIRQWRKKAAKRALLPKVDVSFDKDIDSTISSNTWGSYGSATSPGKYYVGPDDRTNYRNNNYSVSLSWQLGDLIWSDAQTSIDTRSRLLVELRNDILDEVTKIYFERRKVKAELDNLAVGDNKTAEKKIRVQELTALLDGFTNGYFSRQMIK